MAGPGAGGATKVQSLGAVAALQDHARSAAGVLKGMANEQRLLIMCSLVRGSLSVGEVNARVPLSQSALSQHLAVLRDAGLVKTHRRSQTVFYSLLPGPAVEIMEILYREFCAPAARKKSAGTSR